MPVWSEAVPWSSNVRLWGGGTIGGGPTEPPPPTSITVIDLPEASPTANVVVARKPGSVYYLQTLSPRRWTQVPQFCHRFETIEDAQPIADGVAGVVTVLPGIGQV